VYPPPCLSIERSLAKKQPSSAPKTPPKFHEAPPPLPRTRRKARGPRRSKRRSHELLLLLLRTASICHARVHLDAELPRSGRGARGALCSVATQARNAYAAVFPGGNPTRGQGSAAAKATAPPTLAKGLALSRRSRPEQNARCGTRVHNVCLYLDMRHAPATGCALFLPLRVLYRGQVPARRRRPAGVRVDRAASLAPNPRYPLVTGGSPARFSRLLGTRSARYPGRESSTFVVLKAPATTSGASPGRRPKPMGPPSSIPKSIRRNTPLRYRCSYNPRSP
jgi:hypothetical protein